MSGILSKIEALDDFGPEDQSPSARDVAPARAPATETTSAPTQSQDELGELMAPIGPRTNKPPVKPEPPKARQPSSPSARKPSRPRPAPPQRRAAEPQTATEKPVRGPRANISIERPEPKLDLDSAAEALRGSNKPARQKKPLAKQPTATPVAKTHAPSEKPVAKEAPKEAHQEVQKRLEKRPEKTPEKTPGSKKEKRLPPRLRKKMEEEARRKAEEKAEATQPTSKPTPEPGVQSAPAPRPPAPQPPEAAPSARGKIGPPPPLPKAPGEAAPAPQPATAPPPQAEGTSATTVAERSAPPPIMPPPPPTDGGDGGGDGPGRPMPLPDAEPPAHEDRALAALSDATDLSNCLLPLLNSLNWRGDKRHVAEALPHFTNALDVTSFRNVLATLHYQSRPLKLDLTRIDRRLFPCLFLPEKGDAMVLLGYEPDGLHVFDGGLNEERILPRGKANGTAYFFSEIDLDEIQSSQGKVGWFRAVSERFRSLVYQTLGITFVLNILALVTPLFVMAVYDKVVATKSLPTLAFFAFGVGIAIACDLILRMIRSKIMAFIGARLDNIVGIAIFHKILFLPPAFTERATIGAQVARIKDFETIRDFFTGPMALVMFELPFVLIFIITIAVLGGPVAFVSIIMMACFMILGLVITPLLRNSVSRAARASSKKQELIVETLSGMRAVKYCGAEQRWMERFREYSASAALDSFYTAQISAAMQTISHVLMISAGLGTIIFGVFRVLNGDMTVGGLVASMILVWRVLAPLQTGFISLTRVTQVKSSITQINGLMNIKGERDQHALVTPIKQMEGFVTFARVSIRYSPDSDPALVGVSFDIEPGEVLCVVGGNGSGKSTVLKLLAGMYAPQAGSIRVDNMDIRQMDTVELRHAVGYVPQTIQFFYGTIAQNLRLADPTATETDLYAACEKAEVLDDVLALKQGSGKWVRQGFDVRIGDSASGQMPTSLLQRLNLARGYLKKSPIMLFDEPGNGLDYAGDQAFMRAVDGMRGETTVLMVTHRPSHMKLADKILWLEYGNVRAFGPSAEVLAQMPRDFV